MCHPRFYPMHHTTNIPASCYSALSPKFHYYLTQVTSEVPFISSFHVTPIILKFISYPYFLMFVLMLRCSNPCNTGSSVILCGIFCSFIHLSFWLKAYFRRIVFHNFSSPATCLRYAVPVILIYIQSSPLFLILAGGQYHNTCSVAS